MANQHQTTCYSWGVGILINDTIPKNLSLQLVLRCTVSFGFVSTNCTLYDVGFAFAYVRVEIFFNCSLQTLNKEADILLITSIGLSLPLNLVSGCLPVSFLLSCYARDSNAIFYQNQNSMKFGHFVEYFRVVWLLKWEQ